MSACWPSCVDDEQRALNPFYGRLIRVNEQARDGRETFADGGGTQCICRFSSSFTKSSRQRTILLYLRSNRYTPRTIR